MRILDWAVSLFAAAVVAHSDPAPVLTNPQVITLTSYSCERGNETTGCNALRWGGDVMSIGLACPVADKGKVYVIEGMEDLGPLPCDDTPAREWLLGNRHFDLRLPTRQAAVEVGVQTRIVWEATE